MTRSTGKRSTRGALDDGVNSVIRYFNNNFYDGYFEDCLNLTFGRVEMGECCDKLALKLKHYTIVKSGGVWDLGFVHVCGAGSRDGDVLHGVVAVGQGLVRWSEVTSRACVGDDECDDGGVVRLHLLSLREEGHQVWTDVCKPSVSGWLE